MCYTIGILNCKEHSIMNVIVCNNAEAVADKAYEIVADIITAKPDAVLGLATGSTPVGLYRRLIEGYRQGKLSFRKIRSLNLDEYVGLPETHDQSYRYFMNDNLFDHIDIDKAETHVPCGTADDLQKAADEYTRLAASMPRDVQILGIGSNGHIAFNEPGTPFDSETHIVTLKESTRRDNARFFASIDEVPTHAVTMGIKTILNAKKIILVATGTNKADAIYDMINGPISEDCPASALRNHPDVDVIVDRDAAAKL